MDKIKSIYSGFSKFRYLAFENGIAGFRPEKAQEVLRKNMAIARVWPNLTSVY